MSSARPSRAALDAIHMPGAPTRRKFLSASAVAAGQALAASTALRARPARAADAPLTLKIATVAPEGTPWAEQLNSYKQQVEAASKGRLRIKAFLGGALGDENQTISECRRGAIPLWGGSTGALASSVPEISVLELPYLFATPEDADKVLDQVLYQDLRKLMLDRGFVLLMWSENGYRSFGSKWAPVKLPADIKGHKMRSQESQVHLDMYRALGGLPQPIAVTEVLTALQTGVVDGFDQTPLYTFAASWQLGIKYFSVSEHIYQPGVVVASRKEFEKLPADLQKILAGDVTKLVREGRQGVRDMGPLLLQNFETAKIPVYRLTAAEKEAFAKATRPVYDKFVKAVPSAKPLLAKVQATKTKAPKKT
jgi:tripartite ATP-independent transporter DctP family solute receptor